jgi:hypothetical protein
LDKRGGDGGYMIIMQNEDATKRREYILKKKLAKVIYTVENDEAVLVQYHPKGIKGEKESEHLMSFVLTHCT